MKVSIMQSVGGGDGAAVVVKMVVSAGQRDAPLISHHNIGPNLVGRSVSSYSETVIPGARFIL